jgi:hypothetical protein
MTIEQSADAPDRFLDVLEAVGVGEAEISFAELAEGGPGETRDPRLVQEPVRQGAARIACPRDVREDVERSLRLRALEAGDLARPSMIASRRRRNSTTIRSTEPWSPRSAATPAICVNVAVQEVALVCSFATTWAMGAGMMP